jgi:hypothetical protein
MKKQLHSSEEHFKKALEGYEAPFEPKAFHEFTKRLDEAPDKKKYRLLGFFTIAAIFILIGIVIGSLVIYNKMSKEDGEVTEQSTYSEVYDKKNVDKSISNNGTDQFPLVANEDASITKRNNQQVVASSGADLASIILEAPVGDDEVSEVGLGLTDKTTKKIELVETTSATGSDVASKLDYKDKIDVLMQELLEATEDNDAVQIVQGEDYRIRITENLKINNQILDSKKAQSTSSQENILLLEKSKKQRINYLPLLQKNEIKLVPSKTQEIPPFYKASIVPVFSKDHFERYFTIAFSGMIFNDNAQVSQDPFFTNHNKISFAPSVKIGYRITKFLSTQLGYTRKNYYTGFSILAPHDEVDQGLSNVAISSQLLSSSLNLHIPIVPNLIELIPSVSYVHAILDEKEDFTSEGIGTISISNSELANLDYEYRGMSLSNTAGLLGLGAAVSIQLRRIALEITYQRFIGQEDIYTEQYSYAMPESKQQNVDYTYQGGFAGLGLGIRYNLKK